MMKKGLIYLTLLFVCSACVKREKLLTGGAGWPQIAILDKASGKIEWSHPLTPEEECNDLEMTPQGEILYAYKGGARLITRKHEVIWDYRVGEPEAVYTATRLASGHYLLAVAGVPMRIVELDRKGVPVGEVTYRTATRDITRQFRHVLKTPQNTYLVPLIDKHKIVELDEKGIPLRSIYSESEPVAIVLMENGNWLVSCGESRCIVEIQPDARNVVRRIETKDLSYGSLLYVGELVRYRNGNTLIANWDGRDREKTSSALLEIDPGGKVVWRLPYMPEVSNISTVYSFFE
ncbi:MAG: hypothetical protein LBR86_03810 [Tannerella sp.]|jgi:hypothetical protein|nr:hypothetical protein [Tannerella sp.]